MNHGRLGVSSKTAEQRSLRVDVNSDSHTGNFATKEFGLVADFLGCAGTV